MTEENKDCTCQCHTVGINDYSTSCPQCVVSHEDDES